MNFGFNYLLHAEMFIVPSPRLQQLLRPQPQKSPALRQSARLPYLIKIRYSVEHRQQVPRQLQPMKNMTMIT